MDTAAPNQWLVPQLAELRCDHLAQAPPEPADPGPWLSRGMRLAAGLEPPERLQGLAAHDFAHAMGNAAKVQGRP